MIQIKDVWPNHGDAGFVDAWKDTEVRANLDKAASFLESGSENGYGPTSGPGVAVPDHKPSATVPPVDPSGG